MKDIQKKHQTSSCTELYGIEDEKGLFVPSISLEETDEARGLIFAWVAIL